MKIKKTIDLCKKRGYFYLFTPEGGEQWISDGVGIYPLGDAPYLDENTICILFDISAKTREKMVFRVGTAPAGICFDDIAEGEAICEQGALLLGEGKNGVIPYKTQQGIQFIDRKHMEPLEDCGDLEVYERISEHGDMYFAVKRGCILVGLIMPYDIINEHFVKSLRSLAELCAVAWENKRASEEEQMRLKDDDE